MFSFQFGVDNGSCCRDLTGIFDLMEENRGVQDSGNLGKRDSVDENIDHDPYFDMDLGFPEEFEFRISVSRPPGISNAIDLISPADELFYKGQLLPLHLPPRIQMVQNLVDSESGAAADSVNSESFWSKDSSNSDSSCSTSSSSSSNSRDSSGSSQDSECCDSRGSLINAKERTQFPSWRKSAARLKGSLLNLKKSSKVGMDEKQSRDEKQSNAGSQRCKMSDQLPPLSVLSRNSSRGTNSDRVQKKSYHSLSFSDRFSSMDKDREKGAGNYNRSAKEVFQKYFKMIKPLYEKRFQKNESRMDECKESTFKSVAAEKPRPSQSSGRLFFSGNLKMGRRGSGGGSCPSSMRSSPNHSGVLVGMKVVSPSGSTMEELQNAIQGAIAHCKKSNAITTDTQNSKVSSNNS